MKPRHGLRLAAAVLTLVAAARAWVPLGYEPWPDGIIPIAFDLERTAPRTASANWNAAAEDALRAWNVHLETVQLQRVPTEEPAWYENGRNELFFDRQEYDDPWPSGVLAVSFVNYDRGRRVENDVVFNPNWGWTVFGGPMPARSVDFRRVVVHELGHLLGLDHPDEAGQTVAAIMNSRAGDVETPTADDAAGVRALFDREVKVAPIVVISPSAASVVEGEPVSLRVLATGRGPLHYEWFRDGVAVPGATAAVLAFTARPADAGAYSVAIANPAGRVRSATAAVAVRPAQPPDFVRNITRDTTALSGEQVTLAQSMARGDRPLRFQWYRNGVPLRGRTDALLVLDDVQFSDSGDYTLTATNIVGTATSDVMRLQIGPPPSLLFAAGPGFGAVGPGGSAILEAPLQPLAGLTYQWFKDGAALRGQTDRTLRIENFSPGQAGLYSVRVTSSFGSVTGPVMELVGYGPGPFNLLRQPDSRRVRPGETATFAVETDAAAPRYQWLRDGQPIAGATGRTFAITAATYLDRAAYAVEITQGEARIRSGDAELEVESATPLVFRLHPSTHTVVSGTSVNLVGAALLRPPAAGEPAVSGPIVYQWLKDGRELPGATEASLTFAASSATAGRYVLRARAGNTLADSEAADVEISATPRLLPVHPASELLPDLTTPAAREQARLEAIASEVAFRRAGITRYFSRHGVPLRESPYATRTPGTFTETRVAGTGTEVSRPFTLGRASADYPEIVLQPSGGAARLGEPFVLRVAARPQPGLLYSWSHNGSPVQSGDSPEYRISRMTLAAAGIYRVVVQNQTQGTASAGAVVNVIDVAVPIIVLHPRDLTLTRERGGTLYVGVSDPAATIQWFRDGQPLPGATGVSLPLEGPNLVAGDYTVRATVARGSETSRKAKVTFALPQPPRIVAQPENRTVVQGGDTELSIGAVGEPPPTAYQWRKDGRIIPGATDARLKLRGVGAEAAGTYTVDIANAAGSVTSIAATVTVDTAARLVNLATRAAVGRDGDILIAGFVIAGTRPRQVLIRGIGDQLSDFGLEGVLRDPVLSVYSASGSRLATNDDWFRTDAATLAALRQAASSAGAFAAREDARDAALLLTLQPGSYTAQVAGLVATTGVALLEIYELGAPAPERLINLSSRAAVGNGANILIPGLTVSGSTPRRLLIRAVGPGLSALGVGGALADPVMTVFRGGTAIAQNDDWERQPGAAALPAAAAAVGAFPLAAGSRDAALLLELGAGSYTVQVAGAQGSTGVALVEVYETRP